MLNMIPGAPDIYTIPVASIGSTTNTRDPSGNLSGNLDYKECKKSCFNTHIHSNITRIWNKVEKYVKVEMTKKKIKKKYETNAKE